MPDGYERHEFESWMAPGRFGKTLLTTRSPDYVAFGVEIALSVLTPAEGVELLSRSLGPIAAEELASAQALVEDLGGHALALDVAGAALRAERGAGSFATYRAALVLDGNDELEIATTYVGKLPSGHDPSVTSTLARSIARLGEPGRDFLRLAALLAVAPISVSLVIDVFAIADGSDREAARLRAIGAMHDAANGSLVARVGDDASLRQVHTLVSRVTRLLEAEGRRSAILCASCIEALTAQVRKDASTGLPTVAATLQHARHIAGAVATVEQAALLGLVARHDVLRGDYASARDLHERVLDARQVLLGEDHADTLSSLSELAVATDAAGDLRRARALQERALDGLRSLMGEHHRDTLRSMYHLGAVYRGLAELTAARELQERTVEAQARVLGHEDPETLTSMSSLALTLRQLGDLPRAHALDEQVLDARRRVLGEEHPDTLTAMNNAASRLGDLGDVEGARALHVRVLAARERVLGVDHPSTLTSMCNVASHQRMVGDLDGARELEERTIEALVRVLGEDHPTTLTALNNHAMTLDELGDTRAARRLREQVVQARSGALGDEHPDTLGAMNNLAGMLFTAGDLRGALTLYERVVEGSRRVLGDDSPATRAFERNLAVVKRALYLRKRNRYRH